MERNIENEMDTVLFLGVCVYIYMYTYGVYMGLGLNCCSQTGEHVYRDRIVIGSPLLGPALS